MRSGRLRQRLSALDARIDPPQVGQLVIISPETWRAEDLVAFDAARASGDLDQQDVIIERATGRRINRAVPGVHTIYNHPPSLIILRSRSDGT